MAKLAGCAPHLRPGTAQHAQILESEDMSGDVDLVETLEDDAEPTPPEIDLNITVETSGDPDAIVTE